MLIYNLTMNEALKLQTLRYSPVGYYGKHRMDKSQVVDVDTSVFMCVGIIVAPKR